MAPPLACVGGHGAGRAMSTGKCHNCYGMLGSRGVRPATLRRNGRIPAYRYDGDMAHVIAVHPGAVLSDELEERGISQAALAGHIRVLPKTINEICRGKRGISAEMAVKLSRALGASPEFWLNLQKNWELSQVPRKTGKGIKPMAA